MADIKNLVEFILQREGETYQELPGDKGGPTKDGITLATWQSIGYDKNHDGHIDKEDVKLIDRKDYEKVLRKIWDTWQADKIKSQSIANLLVDWVYTSGRWGIVIPQRLLGVEQDGKVGPKTLADLNQLQARQLFDRLWNARLAFFNGIVQKNPSQIKWLKGWKNRLNMIKFVSDGPVVHSC